MVLLIALALALVCLFGMAPVPCATGCDAGGSGAGGSCAACTSAKTCILSLSLGGFDTVAVGFLFLVLGHSLSLKCDRIIKFTIKFIKQ